MTGDDIHALRLRYDLNARAFSDLLGTSQASLWRWEACGARKPNTSAHPARILYLLVAYERPTLAQDLRAAARLGNATYLLWVLLDHVHGRAMADAKTAPTALDRRMTRANKLFGKEQKDSLAQARANAARAEEHGRPKGRPEDRRRRLD